MSLEWREQPQDGSDGHELPTAAESTPASVVFQSAMLPCGRRVRNRLVKVAMYEHLAAFNGGPPNAYHFRLYSEWARYDWGMIITGNVAISQDHLTLGRDVVLPASRDMNSEEVLHPFRKLAECIHGRATFRAPHETSSGNCSNTLAIMQLNHAGRQSSNFIGGRLPFHAPLAPSSIRVGSGDTFMSKIVNSIMFQTPKSMSKDDVLSVIDRFVEGAILAHRTGFDGVQLHVAHGYLLSQFLSPKVNIRQDLYSSENALDIIHTIVQRARESTAKDFVLCIKLNAADYSTTEISDDDALTNSEQCALKHLLAIASWGLVDVVEISGGDYEKPDFMTSENNGSKTPRQAFFSRFSHQALRALESIRDSTASPLPTILLTGGLRTTGLLRSALESRHADLLGIGRGSVLCPDLPSLVLERLKDSHRWDNQPLGREPDLRKPSILEYGLFAWIWSIVPKIKLIGAGVGLAWYVVAIGRIAMAGPQVVTQTIRPEYDRGGLTSVLWMWVPPSPRRDEVQRRYIGTFLPSCFG
ncbi:hypothetical protein BDZ97DRAFT_1751158 [Flammula alnicola]|nr:hypothetical protein BDZ97DRAFT_1751158 [Flammula alnicola]